MEVTMLQMIKLFLMRHKITKPTSMEDKYLFLIDNKIDIYAYRIPGKGRYNNKNILDSIKQLEHILAKDFESEYIIDLNLSGKMLYTSTITEWCSDDDRYIDDIDGVINLWLVLSSILYDKYKLGINSVGSGKLYSNAIKARPYILNDQYIVNRLLSGLIS